MKQVGLLLVASLAGCILDSGSAVIATGTVQAGALCSASGSGDCPPCSTAEGAQCRGQWYSTALLCTNDAQCGGSAGACQSGYCVKKDVDGDGIDDDFENEVAQQNFPKVLLAKGESCGAPHGVVYRVRRHPQNPARFAITYAVLYANDCGDVNGHVGDAETFAITVDPTAQPGAYATVGVSAWAHAGTACGSTSSCETSAGTGACGELPGIDTPPQVVIYASQNKHAEYLSVDTCSSNCLDSCTTGERLTGPLVNAGEPGHPMVTDLTSQGFVTGDGWAKELQHFDPWGSAEFSGGGRVDRPLTDLVAPPGR